MTAEKYPVLSSMNITRFEKFLALREKTLRLRQDELEEHLEQVVAELRTIVADPDSLRVVATSKHRYVVAGKTTILSYRRNWLRRWVYHTDVYGKNIHLEMSPDPEVEASRTAAANALFDFIFGAADAVLTAASKAQPSKTTPESTH